MYRFPRLDTLGLLAVVALAAPGPVACQASYDRAIIYLPDNSRFEAVDVRVSDTEVSFVRDRSPATLGISEVAAIRAYAGTNMGRYALFGAASGVAGVLVADLSAPEEVRTGTSMTPYYVGFAAVGALVGALVGMRQQRYVEVYARPAGRTVSPEGIRVGVRLTITGGER
jgi:hypothetical protein